MSQQESGKMKEVLSLFEDADKEFLIRVQQMMLTFTGEKISLARAKDLVEAAEQNGLLITYRETEE